MSIKTIFLLIPLLVSGPVLSDQNDPHLDILFDRLASTNNPTLANRISEHIWRIWKQVEKKSDEEQLILSIKAMSHRDFDAALELLNPLIKRNPAFAEAWNTRATLYYLRDEYQNSIADIEQTLKLEPRHFGALSGLGLIYTSQGKTLAAIKAFEAALAINPHMSGPKKQLRSLKARLKKQVI